MDTTVTKSREQLERDATNAPRLFGPGHDRGLLAGRNATSIGIERQDRFGLGFQYSNENRLVFFSV
jgi:hypothetical protein